MKRARDIWQSITAHRLFVPALIACAALTLGILLAMEHTRDIIKVRGPYLTVLLVIVFFPIFAFRFFDPHENPRPMGAYFILSGFYFILMDSPNFIEFFRALLFDRVPPGGVKTLFYGAAALAAIASLIHFSLKPETGEGFTGRTLLRISPVKFVVYAILQIIYLNLFIAIAREKFGIFLT